ncbi:hypothetical protein MAR_030247 [Mya arenaria]|uniref:Uncharacterized protein n=1 Tax=Mya arenaria TaxID=6604 RepID=A0ABY7DIN3_MYAAR|nr:hypothetical protein MAR_030247 [Mya arenaria]
MNTDLEIMIIKLIEKCSNIIDRFIVLLYRLIFVMFFAALNINVINFNKNDLGIIIKSTFYYFIKCLEKMLIMNARIIMEDDVQSVHAMRKMEKNIYVNFDIFHVALKSFKTVKLLKVT